MVVTRTRPTLYNLTNELIWPDVINRARSHPEEVTWRDDNGGTALHHSCRHLYSIDVVREMLNSSGESGTSMQDKSGRTPLHIACWSGSSETIRLLLRANRAVASITDNAGRTPLHHACSSVSLPCADTIATLIQADPMVSRVSDDAGKTPLALLCERHESRLLTALASSSTQTTMLVLKPFWEQLRALLLHASSLDADEISNNWRLVHAVTAIPDCPSILLDLALKLHPEQVQEKVAGSLPLHYAAKCPTDDEYPICTLLSLFPRATFVPDAIGRLPLHLAICSGKPYATVLLRLLQAHPDAIRRRDGNNCLLPFMLAAENESTMLDLLRRDPSIGIKQ